MTESALPSPTDQPSRPSAPDRGAPGASRTAAAAPGSFPVRERLIFPLDVPTWEEAKTLVDALGDAVHFYKIGLQLLVAPGTPGYYVMTEWLAKRNKRVMADLKMFDIPETVGKAVKSMRDSGAFFVTVHGNDNILSAAVKEKNGCVRVLAVTVLTSVTEAEHRQLGFGASILDTVLSRARRAQELGCDGVISSGLEAKKLREQCDGGFIIVMPGVRPGKNDYVDLTVANDDQRRTVTIHEAFDNGADFIVMGRPLLDPQATPKQNAERVQASIGKWFDAKAKSS